jgi:hypothetical protein
VGHPDDADRLERLLVDAQYIEALVSARIEDDSAVFAISAGPRYRAEVVGMPQAPPLETTLKDARFEGEALDRGRNFLLDDARKRGYGRAKWTPRRATTQAGARSRSSRAGAPTQVTVTFPGRARPPRAAPADGRGGSAEFLAAPQRARGWSRANTARRCTWRARGEPEVTESADHRQRQHRGAGAGGRQGQDRARALRSGADARVGAGSAHRHRPRQRLPGRRCCARCSRCASTT